jgi:hypothetical protein
MKIEREMLLDYTFQSRMPDVGEYKRKFKLLRKRPKLDTAFVATKSALLGGQIPANRGDELLIDAISTLSVYFEPVDDSGVPSKERDWVDNILDQEIIFDLYKKFIDYQESFYKMSEGSDAQAPVQS